MLDNQIYRKCESFIKIGLQHIQRDLFVMSLNAQKVHTQFCWNKTWGQNIVQYCKIQWHDVTQPSTSLWVTTIIASYGMMATNSWPIYIIYVTWTRQTSRLDENINKGYTTPLRPHGMES